ncbi:MAG: hypothetical protein ACKOA9_02815, partial [Actinomycetota bacterium]
MTSSTQSAASAPRRRVRRADHHLNVPDQTALALLDATGRNQLVQAIWWYERGVDLDGVRRFVDAFAAGPGNRIIERSRVPGACGRWVRPNAEPCVQLGTTVRPRAELTAWADSCASGPVHPVDGPSWRVDVQDFADGSGAVCFTASHVIGDAFGSFMILRRAIAGVGADPGYDTAGTRGWWTGLVSDLALVVRSLPATARGLFLVARLRWHGARSRTAPAQPAAPPMADDDDIVHIPSVVVRADLDRWNTRAHERGGNSATMLMAFTARLAARVGHTRPDGRITLLMPVSVREGPDDLRALAFQFGRATLDPASALGEQRSIRDALEDARVAARSDPGPATEVLAVLPWLSRRGIRKFVDRLFAYSDDAPVSLSNLGVLPADLASIDGSEADWFIARPIDTNVRRADLRRTNGHLVVVAAAVRATARSR